MTATWVPNYNGDFFVADMGYYHGSTFPAPIPPSCPTGCDELDYYVVNAALAGNEPANMPFTPYGVSSDSYLGSGGGGDAYINDDSGENVQPTAARLYVVWYADGFGLSPGDPLPPVAPETLVSSSLYGTTPVVIPQRVFRRWKLQTLDTAPDAGQSMTFSWNPNSQESPLPTQALTYYFGPSPVKRAHHTDGRFAVQMFSGVRSKRTPISWSFSGVLFNEAEYQTLLSWCRRPERLVLINDRKERFELRITGFSVVRSTPVRQRNPMRRTYTVKATVYDYKTDGAV